MEISVDHRLPAFRVERSRQAMGQRTASLHRHRGRRSGKARIRALGSAFQRLRSRPERLRARLRQHPNPPPGYSRALVQSAWPDRRAASPPLRLLPRRADLRHTAAWRHRAGHRPRGHAPRRRKIHSRSHRLRQDHRRPGSDGRLAIAGGQRSTRPAGNRYQARSLGQVMDTSLPSAIRKDHDLFALAGLHFLSPYLAFLPFLRWTSYSCPHCNRVFRRDYWPNNVRLGNGERTCRECARVFDDGSREWPELSLARRLRFLFPPLLRGISGGFVVAAILGVFITPRDEHSWLVVVIVLGFSLIPVIM